ncbi:MAG: TraA family conjugative transfer protein, partial [Duodenibacillus sp.]
QAAWAASDGSEFKDLYDLVAQWSTGFLGKTIAVAFLLVGLGMGVVRGSVMAVVAAIAAAAALILLPSIVDAMFTAYNSTP